MIEYIKGNLFTDYDASKRTLLIHGANRQGKMNSGVAKTFHRLYPEAFEKYVNDIYQGIGLGGVSVYQQNPELLLVSAITQEFYGRDDKRYVSYDAINKAFLIVYGMAIHIKATQVIFPKIGAGLGGGDWNVIESCIISAQSEALIDPKKVRTICFIQ